MKSSLIGAIAIVVLWSAIGFSAAPQPLPPPPDQWTHIGHGLLPNLFTGGHNLSGRAIQVAWRRDDRQGNQNILWVGTQFGGLWKSILDASGDVTSFVPLTDNFPGPHLMESFLVNRTDSDKILVGTGGGSGEGKVYRTHDQGATWRAHRLPHVTTPTRVSRLVDDRVDPDTVLAATGAGIYWSDDFGKIWHLGFGGQSVNDVVQDTGDPAIWYAATPKMPHVILRSKNHGKKWDEMPLGADRITGDVGRISLAACASNENVLFALVAQPKGDKQDGALNGLYRSIDRGLNWTNIFFDNEMVNSDNQALHTLA